MKYICSNCEKVFTNHTKCKEHEMECSETNKSQRTLRSQRTYIKYIVLDRDFDDNEIHIWEHPNAINIHGDYYNLAPGTNHRLYDDTILEKDFEKVVIDDNYNFSICTKFSDEEHEKKYIEKLFERKREEIEQRIQELKDLQDNLNKDVKVFRKTI